MYAMWFTCTINVAEVTLLGQALSLLPPFNLLVDVSVVESDQEQPTCIENKSYWTHVSSKFTEVKGTLFNSWLCSSLILLTTRYSPSSDARNRISGGGGHSFRKVPCDKTVHGNTCKFASHLSRMHFTLTVVVVFSL